MKQLLCLLLMLWALAGCGSGAPEDPALPAPEAGDPAPGEPTSAQLEAVRAEMAALAEGRWTEYAAEWSPETAVFTLRATAGPTADAAAIKGYCRLLDDIARTHLVGVKVSTAVYFPSGSKIECK